MKGSLVLVTGTLIGLNVVAWAEPGDPVAAPAPTATEARPAPDRPKPAAAAPAATEKPKPVERPAPPRPQADAPKPAPALAARPAETPAPEVVPAPAAAEKAACSEGLACWLVGFAMLVLGFAAGFIARHLVSRRKLGGMTVRIGTWRGIP